MTILLVQGVLCLVQAFTLLYQGKTELVVLYAAMAAVCAELWRKS